ncbi:uncharacterized protein troap isoform X2 [Synchiropus splendidus]|uniref:uncharacterized protein troap isoform X2 n=1 Tax=Synchiropus splendidus TaxID=270530 RepID=UPI00237E24E2|nr:uncharacterized protein troap isoform X2 [Synchiropus splendidus]
MTDSPAVLRPQTRSNQINSDCLRSNNVSNKELRSSRTGSAPPPKENSENQDPLKSNTNKKTAFRPKVSRLPVPVKSLQPPSHSGWEDKPLTGKATKKRCTTRPVPFNLSQPRGSRVNSLTSPALLQCAASAQTFRPKSKPGSVTASLLGPSVPATSAHRDNSTALSSRVKDPAVTPQACELDQKEKSSRSRQLLRTARVPVKRTQEKTPATQGSLKSAQFSTDPAALRSILQNEGLKTPTACPARNTPLSSALRVPVRKAAESCVTPAQRWSPQRVQDTRHKPMSSMKWFHSCPSHRVGNRSTCQLPREAVVQRLFEDPPSQEQDPVSQELHQSASTTEVTRSGLDQCPEESGQQQPQPFLQHQQRDSVIFFSTGKKTFRSSHFEKRQHHVNQPQPGPLTSAGTEAACLLKPPQDMSKTLGPASALRQRLPLLEDLLLDLEISTYTSIPASGVTATGPRCGNPVASFLLCEESKSFVPIVLDPCWTQSPSLLESPSPQTVDGDGGGPQLV